MPSLNYFFSFDGRFPRKKWWGYLLVALLLNLPLVISTFLFFGAAMFTIMTFGMGGSILNKVPGPNEIIQPFFGSFSPYITYFLFFIGLYLLIFSSIKRLHDRGRSGWWLMFFPLNFILQYFLFKYTQPGDSLSLLAGLVSLVLFSWILNECSSLKGTTGDNEFGQDPLAAQN
jgi:uncharacterized membrane protein YhaH (DUF805 family)